MILMARYISICFLLFPSSPFPFYVPLVFSLFQLDKGPIVSQKAATHCFILGFHQYVKTMGKTQENIVNMWLSYGCSPLLGVKFHGRFPSSKKVTVEEMAQSQGGPNSTQLHLRKRWVLGYIEIS